MNIHFNYDRNKDIWCLVNKGKSSNNSINPTKQYQELLDLYGSDPTEDNVTNFIDKYIVDNGIDIENKISQFQSEWETISQKFQKIAEEVFGVQLNQDINVYLTINSRCPYSIIDNSFYVSLTSKQAVVTVMHELWHFYTWYGLGANQEQKLGKQKYNDLKEALTVLINIECLDILPVGVTDKGYLQHKDIRDTIIKYWNTNRDIKKLWSYMSDSDLVGV